jgi:serine/threonine protein kinase/tetratricopeptide (TPR) repeat protein
MSNQPTAETPDAIFEQIGQLSRQFRKQIAKGEAPRIERFLEKVADGGKENLFSSLLDVEISFRRSQGESPTSAEYLKRFPQYTRLVRRAFFEPTIDPGSASEDGGATVPSDDHDDDQAFAPTFEIPAKRLGDYELLGQLGQGGMGVVYDARHTKTGNRVALKTLRTHVDGQQVDANKLYRFRKEFRSLSEVNHPNLVGMQTLEVDDNQWFFTMDLIEGEDFISYVRPNNQLDEARLRACLPQLAKGIIALHQRGIVHRDLKPGNVMVTDQGHVLILDFGLVAELQQNIDATQTRSAMFVGTIPYAAPEQMFGERTEANDWYGFGTMVYEALVGKVPFPGNNQANLLRKQQEDPPTLADHDDVPSDLAELADGLLRREAGPRLGADTVAEFLKLDDDTRIQSSAQGSTLGSMGIQGSKGSQGSSGSVYEENVDFDTIPEEEIVLIGREKQLAQLEKIKQEFLKCKEPSVVWVTGLSGEGKSSLVEKFLQPIRRHKEMLVLSGRCYDRESVPFKAVDCLIDPLVRYLRSSSESDLKRMLPDDIAMLAHLFPLLQRVRAIADRRNPQILSLDSKQIRYRAFEAFRELLVTIGERLPIVLFIDDLQWGDADSSSALHALLVGTEPPPVLFLGTYRSDEREESSFHRQWSQLDQETRDNIPRHELAIAPLDQQQCTTLIAARTGTSRAEAHQVVAGLFESTKGNPYFLEQMIEGFNAGATDWRPLPLAEIITGKLRRLAKGCEILLQHVSVAGKATQANELAAVSGMGIEVLSLLTHMRSERLVRLVGSGESQLVDTWHDKIRETVLANMDPGKPRALHLQFAESVELSENLTVAPVEAYLSQPFTSPATPEFSTARVFDMAYHFQMAEDPRARAYQFLAGELAFQSYASEEAIEYLNRAKDLFRGDEPSPWHARLWHRLATSSYRIMDFDRSLEQFDSGIEFTESGLEKAHFYLGRARIHQTRSDYNSAAENHDLALTEIGRKRPRGILAYPVAAFHFLKIAVFPDSWLRTTRPSTHEDLFELSIYMDMVQYLFERFIPQIEYPAVALRLGVQEIPESVSFSMAHLAASGFSRLGRRLALRARSQLHTTSNMEAEGLLQFGCAVSSSYSCNFREADQEFNVSIPKLLKSGSHIFAASAMHMRRHLYESIGTASVEINAAASLIALATNSGDLRGQCWGHYDHAGGLARFGNLSSAFKSIMKANSAWELCTLNLTTPIYFANRGFVFLQASQYEEASLLADRSWRTAVKNLRVMDVCLRGLAWNLESIAGRQWATDPNPFDRRLVRQRCRWARVLAQMHVKIRPHLLRARGRAFIAGGKNRKGIHNFEQAVKSARQLGMKYDLGKSLLDLAAVKEEGREENRAEAIRLLKEMESVIPRAESWLLGDQYDEAVVAPEFDLEAWEREHGPIDLAISSESA